MHDLSLTALNLAVIAIVALSAIVALARGLVREVFELAAWIGALVVAWYAFGPASPILREAIGNDILANLATATAVFVVPLIVFKVLGGVISNAVSGSGVGFLDRILGLLFGVARGALLVVVAYIVGSLVVKPEDHPSWVKDARVLPVIQRAAGELWAAAPSEIEQRARGALGTPAVAGTKPGEKGYTTEERGAVEKLFPRN